MRTINNIKLVFFITALISLDALAANLTVANHAKIKVDVVLTLSPSTTGSVCTAPPVVVEKESTNTFDIGNCCIKGHVITNVPGVGQTLQKLFTFISTSGVCGNPTITINPVIVSGVVTDHITVTTAGDPSVKK